MISCSVVPLVGGWYSVLKVRARLAEKALLNEVVRNYDFLLRPFLDNKRVTSEFLLSVFQMLNTAIFVFIDHITILLIK